MPKARGRRRGEEADQSLQLSIVPGGERQILEKLRSIDVNTLTPIECMTQLCELTALAKKE